MKYLFIIFISIILLSCSKKEEYTCTCVGFQQSSSVIEASSLNEAKRECDKGDHSSIQFTQCELVD